MIWFVPLVVLILFEALADVLAKQWSLKGSAWLAAAALFAYLLGNSSWLIALKHGSGLARGAVVFSVTSAVLAVLIGLVIYHERLSTPQAIGVLLGLISLALIFWS